MTDELAELIRVARRKLQRASGIPPTVDEQAEERRLAELEEMDIFTLLAFGPRLQMALKMKTNYRDSKAVAEMTVEGHIFQLRKDAAAFVLLIFRDGGDVELARIDRKDPDFANRVLVAIADELLT